MIGQMEVSNDTRISESTGDSSDFVHGKAEEELKLASANISTELAESEIKDKSDISHTSKGIGQSDEIRQAEVYNRSKQLSETTRQPISTTTKIKEPITRLFGSVNGPEDTEDDVSNKKELLGILQSTITDSQNNEGGEVYSVTPLTESTQIVQTRQTNDNITPSTFSGSGSITDADTKSTVSALETPQHSGTTSLGLESSNIQMDINKSSTKSQILSLNLITIVQTEVHDERSLPEKMSTVELPKQSTYLELSRTSLSALNEQVSQVPQTSSSTFHTDVNRNQKQKFPSTESPPLAEMHEDKPRLTVQHVMRTFGGESEVVMSSTAKPSDVIRHESGNMRLDDISTPHHTVKPTQHLNSSFGYQYEYPGLAESVPAMTIMALILVVLAVAFGIVLFFFVRRRKASRRHQRNTMNTSRYRPSPDGSPKEDTVLLREITTNGDGPYTTDDFDNSDQLDRKLCSIEKGNFSLSPHSHAKSRRQLKSKPVPERGGEQCVIEGAENVYNALVGGLRSCKHTDLNENLTRPQAKQSHLSKMQSNGHESKSKSKSKSTAEHQTGTSKTTTNDPKVDDVKRKQITGENNSNAVICDAGENENSCREAMVQNQALCGLQGGLYANTSNENEENSDAHFIKPVCNTHPADNDYHGLPETTANRIDQQEEVTDSIDPIYDMVPETREPDIDNKPPDRIYDAVPEESSEPDRTALDGIYDMVLVESSELGHKPPDRIYDMVPEESREPDHKPLEGNYDMVSEQPRDPDDSLSDRIYDVPEELGIQDHSAPSMHRQPVHSLIHHGAQAISNDSQHDYDSVPVELGEWEHDTLYDSAQCRNGENRDNLNGARALPILNTGDYDVVADNIGGVMQNAVANRTGPHDYDPVYIPSSDAQAMSQRVDSTGYVRSRGPKMRLSQMYEVIPYADLHMLRRQIRPTLQMGASAVSGIPQSRWQPYATPHATPELNCARESNSPLQQRSAYAANQNPALLPLDLLNATHATENSPEMPSSSFPMGHSLSSLIPAPSESSSLISIPEQVAEPPHTYERVAPPVPSHQHTQSESPPVPLRKQSGQMAHAKLALATAQTSHAASCKHSAEQDSSSSPPLPPRALVQGSPFHRTPIVPVQQACNARESDNAMSPAQQHIAQAASINQLQDNLQTPEEFSLDTEVPEQVDESFQSCRSSKGSSNMYECVDF